MQYFSSQARPPPLSNVVKGNLRYLYGREILHECGGGHKEPYGNLVICSILKKGTPFI
jgi:hypothetical protein